MLDGTDIDMCGSGTEKDPYKVTSDEDLQEIEKDLTAHYILVSDIDAEETSEWNDGKGFDPIGSFNIPFIGTFDGKGYQIMNLYINRPEENWTGLFAANRGQIRDVKITSSTITGNNKVGGLVSQNRGGYVGSCCINANVSGGDYVGGLAGLNKGRIDSSCATGDVSGSCWTGGFLGDNNGYIGSCRSRNTVLGHFSVGGLVGENQGKVESSHSIGDVSGQRYIGGLIGVNRSTLRSAYSIGGVSGNREIRGIVGVSSNRSDLNGVFDFSVGKYDDLVDAGFVISKDDWEISYIVETNMLYIEVNDTTYSCPDVSTNRAQKLLAGFRKYTSSIRRDFKASIVGKT